MKKGIILIFAALFVLGLSSTSFAHRYGKSMGASYITIEGEVVSINQAKNSFVLRCHELGKKTTVSGSSDQVSSLKAGDLVKVVLPQTSNRAQKIEKR